MQESEYIMKLLDRLKQQSEENAPERPERTFKVKQKVSGLNSYKFIFAAE